MPGQAATSKRGVLYIGHMPHGLEEKELYKYFSQFGKVNRVKVSRSIKTGKPKGYGFVQFRNDEVALIAAQSMNNYIMFRKSLKVHLVEPEKVHDTLFGTSGRPLVRSKRTQRAIVSLNQTSSRPQNVERRTKRRQLAAKKLKDMGYELSASDVKGSSIPTDSKSELVKLTAKPTASSKMSITSKKGTKKHTSVDESTNVEVATGKKEKRVTVNEDSTVIIRPEESAEDDDEISFNISDDTLRPSSSKKALTGSSTKKVFPKTPVPHRKSSMATSSHSSQKKSPHKSPAAASPVVQDSGASPALTNRVKRKSVTAPQTPKNKPAKMSPRVTRSLAKKRKSVV